MSRSWALRAWALLASCSASAVGAEVGGARLSVARSADALSCPDDEVLAARVRQLRDGKADVPPLRIDVLLQRHAEGYRARIRVSGPRSGERELSTQEGSCGGLADALSVSLALLLDEEALPAPPPAGPAAPERAPREGFSGPYVAPPTPAGGWLLSLGGGVGVGLPSGVALLVLPGLRYRSEQSRWGVGGRWAWSPEQRRGFEGGQVAVALWRGEVEGCWRLVERGWSEEGGSWRAARWRRWGGWRAGGEGLPRIVRRRGRTTRWGRRRWRPGR